MIKLTRLNGSSFSLNAIYIEQIQSFPDTTITLTNGKKIVVRENEDDVILLVTDFFRQISILGQLQLPDKESL
ncbi:flagellar protein FlbD [Bacillus mesophilus]|uniref:Flagellar FlbD family protein n=1 Tax=Bacillus mesophilus TaxID=1808955 RepID=A0A6M0Q4Y2_9BACI|nr:flagellar FlbD family protein [Bacillus mesophilus]MBM7659356.1 flagellar protein FlbD [Bacillus mesophilus]NEY70228.1 flagellar FlbD family protein [Bacillus mesophilus]